MTTLFLKNNWVLPRTNNCKLYKKWLIIYHWSLSFIINYYNDLFFDLALKFITNLKLKPIIDQKMNTSQPLGTDPLIQD